MAEHARRRLGTRGEGLRVAPPRGDVGLHEAHRRFGGLDVPASLAGTLCALGTAVLLAGLVTGAGSIGYRLGARGSEAGVSVAGMVAGLIVLLAAFGTGGWVAGRMSRYDGGRNGLMTAVWFVVLAAIVAILGGWLGHRYDFLSRFDLPQWFSGTDRGPIAIGTGIVAVAVMLIAGTLGGKLGDRYHRGADQLITATRPTGIGVIGISRGLSPEGSGSGRMVLKPSSSGRRARFSGAGLRRSDGGWP
jgi:hypothetical protein